MVQPGSCRLPSRRGNDIKPCLQWLDWGSEVEQVKLLSCSIQRGVVFCYILGNFATREDAVAGDLYYISLPPEIDGADS